MINAHYSPWIKIFLALALGVLVGCQPTQKPGFQVVATTGMLGDAAQVLLEGVDSVSVKVLMGPGVDPHLYRATQGDIEALARADVILYNGLHLEGKMQDVFDRLQDRSVIVAAQALPEEALLNATEYQNAHDPHIWFDPVLWEQVIGHVAAQLAALRPAESQRIKANRRRYRAQIRKAHAWAQRQMEAIPPKQRVMITAHDAFKYLGQRYQMEVRGLQGISTTAEYGIRDITDLVDLIMARQIKAIFVESSVPKRSVEAVIAAARSRGHELKLGGTLYSDALGPEGSPADTYLGMFYHNVSTIKNALQ